MAPPAGMPDHEMAAATGAGVSALKMRVHRAAAALVAFLEEAGEG